MKKLLYTAFALAMVFGSAACNKDTLQDVYDHLDTTVVKPVHRDVTYTLTAADYTAIKTTASVVASTDDEKKLANAVSTNGALNKFATADRFVPAILKKAFPALNKNSSVKLTYNYSLEAPEYLAKLGAAQTYTVSAADYEALWDGAANYFTPAKSAEANLPKILKAANTSAVDGDILIASFKYSDIEPVQGAPVPTFVSEDFESYAAYDVCEKNGWTAANTTGTKKFLARNRNNNSYAQISAYGGLMEATESWMISPRVKIGTEGGSLSFDVVTAYFTHNGLKVLISTEANAATKPETAKWDDVTAKFTIPAEPANGYSASATAGTLALDAYKGKQIFVAFKYNGDNTNQAALKTTTYQIDNVKIGRETGVRTRSMITTPVARNLIYTYKGTKWEPYENAFILNQADYAAMGLASKPYLSADAVAKYMPAYLAKKVEYAAEGDKKTVLYNSSATAKRASDWILIGGKWQAVPNYETRTEQFMHTGSEWIFDPAINYTLVTSDYQLMADYVLNHPTLNVYKQDTYTNCEWYYGFNAYYVNVNLRIEGSTRSTRDIPCSKENDKELHSLKTVEEKIALLWKRLEKEGMPIFLSRRFPDAVTEVKGIPQLYHLTVNIYGHDGVISDTNIYRMTFKVVKVGTAGSPATFEFVEKANLGAAL